MSAEMLRLPLPDPDDDGHPLDWYPEPDLAPKGLPGVLSETSYTLPEGLNIGEWLGIGETLQQMERSIGWWLGDWWNYGTRHYGAMASQASRDHVKDATGHTYNTVRQAGMVAKRFELDDRSSDVSWTHHLVVADLPKEDANALLKEAAEEGLTKRETLERAQERKKVIAVEAALAAPPPDPERIPTDVRVEVADARALPIDDETVHLIVTSPPYGLDVAYRHGDIEASDWRAFMYQWLVEAFRVTVESGRLALNVPLDTTRPLARPTYSQAVQMAMAAGWTYRSTIVWFDDQLGKSVARGSLDSAAAPSIIAGAEMVALFSKGEWKRETPCSSDLERQDWLDWTNGVWKLPGESRAWEGHPAPFPYELPRRLIRLLSFPGDVVCDPFVGSGTTVRAAAQQHRAALGFDVSPEYVASALRRVVA